MSQKAPKSKRRSKPESTLRSTLSLTALAPHLPPPAKKQKTKAVTSISRPPVFDLSGIQPSVSQDVKPLPANKGKAKANAEEAPVAEDTDDRLWVDRYEPITEDDLAVNKRKVQDVRQWLLEALTGGPSGKLKKYRRILALTGPAGTGKTATLRVLARELGFALVEWRNGADEPFARADGGWDDDYEGLADKFRAFLARAASCRSVFAAAAASAPPGSQSRQQVILLEDLPNILHAGTQAAFHAALSSFAAHPAGAPLVLVLSDAGLRGEDAEGGGGGWARAREAVDVRSALPPDLLHSPYVTEIAFRPIAPTYMRPALQALLDRRFPAGGGPGKDVVSLVVDSANGDIRSAVMALQFACPAPAPAAGRGKGKAQAKGHARALMEVVTRREQSLALFHLLGKLFYNKRKGDPPGAGASAKERERDRALDARLRDEPPLPAHLRAHARRASRVDVEALHADSPVDASLLSLYVHENYSQYCDALGECAALADTLSALDADAPEWHQAPPHAFHALALGTLHALPTPVARRGQRPYKPAFFGARGRARGAEDALRDVQDWLMRDVERGAGVWSRREVVLGLGAVLRAREMAGAGAAPPTHRRFSQLEFARTSAGLVQLGEEEGGAVPGDELDADEAGSVGGEGEGEGGKADEGRAARGWLSDDDIEEFSE